MVLIDPARGRSCRSNLSKARYPHFLLSDQRSAITRPRKSQKTEKTVLDGGCCSPKSPSSYECSTATPVPRAQMPQLRARPPRTKQSHRAQRCALSATTCRRSSPVGCGLKGASAGGAASCWGAGGRSGGAVAFASCARLLAPRCARLVRPIDHGPERHLLSCGHGPALASRTEAAVAPP